VADPLEALARYFERAKAIVERRGGVVEKFIGDAVMAVFGLPAGLPRTAVPNRVADLFRRRSVPAAALPTVGEGGVSHVRQARRGLPIVYESRGVEGA
jgi:class 3 adenylate cyclase